MDYYTSSLCTPYNYDGFIFFQILFIIPLCVVPRKFNQIRNMNFLIRQIGLYNTADGLILGRSIFFSASVVKVKPLFITGDDSILNFILMLMFEQINATLNITVFTTRVTSCRSQQLNLCMSSLCNV